MDLNTTVYTKEIEAGMYIMEKKVIQDMNHLYDHTCSLEFIIDTIREAFIAGWERNKSISSSIS